MKAPLLFLLLLISFSSLPNAQDASGDPKLFDFWTGEWELWWYGQDSVKEYGTNTISKILDSTVIHENFAITSGTNKGFKGQSVSVLEANTKIWRQTWVDNSGAYMDFTGRQDGNNRIFERELTRNNKLFKQRMIFHDITRNSFQWDWTSSTDEGKTWKLIWRIYYQRKK